MIIDEELKNNIIKYFCNFDGEVPILEIVEEILKNKAIKLDFKKPDPDNMLDVAEEEKIQGDSLLIRNYIQGLDTYLEPAYDKYELDEYGCKILYKDKEIAVGCSTSEFYSEEQEGKRLDITFSIEIDSLKRMHIQSLGNFNGDFSYEKCFIDYEKYIDEYDQKYDEEYAPYFSDRLIKINEKDTLNLEKYKLSESDKEFLTDILMTYKFPFSLVMKDGYLFIVTLSEVGTINEEYVDSIFNIIEGSLKIIEKFMNI